MQRTYAGRKAKRCGHVDGHVDIHSGEAVCSIVHWPMVAASFSSVQRCYTLSMIGNVKRLRHQGKRLSDREISAAPVVFGEVRIYGVGSSIVANVTDRNSQIGDPLLPTLYEARLTTMHGLAMLLKGEERPSGDAGPAYVQEWSIRTGD